MSSVKSNTFEIPKNAQVIQIDDDQELIQQMPSLWMDQWINEMIASAIMTKSLDQMKKAIFMCLIRKKLDCDLDKLNQILKQKYLEYFKEKLNLNIITECYNPKHQVPNKNSNADKKLIIVHGVDFLTNNQIQSKFKGVHGVTVIRINSSNASIRFSENQNVENILELESFKHVKNDDIEQIENEGEFSWKMLKKYNVMGFDRILKYRFGSEDEEIMVLQQNRIKQFEDAKNQIQRSGLFIENNEDKIFYDQQMHKFEQSLNQRYRRRSVRNRSEMGEHSNRQRCRNNNNRQRSRDQNFRSNREYGIQIDGFKNKFNRGFSNKKNQFQYKNQENYHTQRRNHPYYEQNQSFTDRNSYYMNNHSKNEFQKQKYDRHSQNRRQNNFFKKQNYPNNPISTSRSISIQNNSKSKSISKSNSSRSLGLNQSIRDDPNSNQSLNQTINLTFNDKKYLNSSINKSMNQSQSFALQQCVNNNFSMFKNPHQEDVSMIIPENTMNQSYKQNDSVDYLLERLSEDKNKIEQENSSKSLSIRSNDNLNKKSARNVNSSVEWQQRNEERKKGHSRRQSNENLRRNQNYNQREFKNEDRKRYDRRQYQNKQKNDNNQRQGYDNKKNNERRKFDNQRERSNNYQRQNHHREYNKKDVNNQNKSQNYYQNDRRSFNNNQNQRKNYNNYQNHTNNQNYNHAQRFSSRSSHKDRQNQRQNNFSSYNNNRYSNSSSIKGENTRPSYNNSYNNRTSHQNNHNYNHKNENNSNFRQQKNQSRSHAIGKDQQQEQIDY